MHQPLHSSAPLLDCSSLSMFPLFCGAQNWTHYYRCSLTSTEDRRRITSLQPLTMLFLKFSPRRWPPLWQGCITSSWSICDPQDPRHLFCTPSTPCPGVGLCISLCYPSRSFCWPISPAHQFFCWIAEHSSSISTTPSSITSPQACWGCSLSCHISH